MFIFDNSSYICLYSQHTHLQVTTRSQLVQTHVFIYIYHISYIIYHIEHQIFLNWKLDMNSWVDLKPHTSTVSFCVEKHPLINLSKKEHFYGWKPLSAYICYYVVDMCSENKHSVNCKTSKINWEYCCYSFKRLG